MTQRIEVATNLLRQKITDYIKREDAAHEQRKATYDEELSMYKDAVLKALLATADRLSITGELPTAAYRHVDVPMEIDCPKAVTPNSQMIARAQKALEMLSIASKPTITLTTDSEWLAYL